MVPSDAGVFWRMVTDALRLIETDAEELLDAVEGYADARRKGLTEGEAAVYALLEMKSRRLAEDEAIAELMGWQGVDKDERKERLRELFRAIARQF